MFSSINYLLFAVRSKQSLATVPSPHLRCSPPAKICPPDRPQIIFFLSSINNNSISSSTGKHRKSFSSFISLAGAHHEDDLEGCKLSC
jgi:hypothetical protein